MKEEVIIEYIDGQEVSIVPYDTYNKIIIGGSIDVLTLQEAREKYEIIGELANGDVKLYSDDYEEEIYDESFDEMFEEEA